MGSCLAQCMGQHVSGQADQILGGLGGAQGLPVRLCRGRRVEDDSRASGLEDLEEELGQCV